MTKPRRIGNAFSLSFLDIMSCGLGAAVLLFLIIKHNVDEQPATHINTDAEVNLLAEDISQGQAMLARIRNSISAIDDELAVAQGLASQVQEDVTQLDKKITKLSDEQPETPSDLLQKIAALEQEKQSLSQTLDGGKQIRQFEGEGRRQYLTGLKLGGERALILLDSSASMIDKTLVNIIIGRLRPDAVKRNAPKWQQAVQISDWLLANLDANAYFQLLEFNSTTHAAYTPESANALSKSAKIPWLQTNNNLHLDGVSDALAKITPQNGTNLKAALRAALQMNPRPDNIFLITDGLPTLENKQKTTGKNISSRDRYKVFTNALNELGNEIPVNIILLPLEGDPLAAAAYWQMAIKTGGSMIAPPEDWP